MADAAEIRKLRQEVAMRIFVRDSQKQQSLTVEQGVEYHRLSVEGDDMQLAYDYLLRMSAQNACAEAEVFVEAYFGKETAPVQLPVHYVGLPSCTSSQLGEYWSAAPDEVTCVGCRMRMLAEQEKQT